MSRTAEDYELALRDAVDTYDEPTAGQLVEEMVQDLESGRLEVQADQAKAMLTDLRKKRYFALLEEAASAFGSAGRVEPNVRRQLVQGLIDQGELEKAEVEVRKLISETDIAESEGAEARGLLGRIHKQAYVDSSLRSQAETGIAGASGGDPNRLQEAVRSYLEVYGHDPHAHYWHGINVVACLARAERDGVQVAEKPDWRELARKIFGDVRRARPADWDYTWRMATALEATMAVCQDEDAVSEAHKWAERYIRARESDAFELGSTIRQLREVWQIEGRPESERAILNTLLGAQLRKRGALVELSSQELRNLESSDSLKGDFGDEARVSITDLRKAFGACRSVGRVEDENGKWEGTGFLLEGGSLMEKWGREPVLITNAHVVHDPPIGGSGIHPSAARIHFSAKEGAGTRVEVREVVWQSPIKGYDTAVLRLAHVPEDTTELVRGTKPSGANQRLPIIGHPLGEELNFSLFDNHFVGYRDPCYLHYRSSTDHGSSGSPVFDEEWGVVAAHHAKRLAGNEGILLDALRDVIQKNPGGII